MSNDGLSNTAEKGTRHPLAAVAADYDEICWGRYWAALTIFCGKFSAGVDGACSNWALIDGYEYSLKAHDDLQKPRDR